MSTSTRAALALASVLLGCLYVGAGDALARTVSDPPPAALPAQLQALEQKMAALRLTSERFSIVSRGFINLTNEDNGKPEGPTRRVSLDASETGEVALPSHDADISLVRHSGASREIHLGSTTYAYMPKLARFDGGRPWVRSHVAGGFEYPFEGGSGEVDAGGTGPYAQLLNLLATATGNVVVSGPLTVDGQQAYEFEVSVNPLDLVGGLTQEDLQRLKADPVVDRLTLYITESGLPVRVVEDEHNNPGANSIASYATIDVLAVNAPVVIKAPPAVKTIAEARYETILKKHSRELGENGWRGSQQQQRQ